ncbi:MAG: hypothetical protein JO227_21595 [Acetobacteraceae bacterium]|nr:hypothetical protein [Acetobacteraceae bacterium]
MDEELRAYLDSLRADLVGRINAGNARILDRLTALERDFANTKEFLVGDALVASRRWLDLEARVRELEQRRNGGREG